MSDDEVSIESLERNKRAVMRNLNGFKNEIEKALKENPSEDIGYKIDSCLILFKESLSKLETITNEIIEATDTSKMNPSQVIAEETKIFNDHDTMQKYYALTKGKLNAMFARLNRSSEPSQNQPRRSTNSSFIVDGAPNNPLVKLPDIPVPKFDGKIKNFTEWHSLFEAMIDSNENLKPVQKLYYLKQAMKGDAENLLKDYQIQEGLYEQAWKFVKERYFNKRVIISNHFCDLIDLPTITMSTLRESLDRINAIIRGLKVCSIDTEKMSPLIAYIVVRKLPEKIRTDWENSHTDFSTYPSFEPLSVFLQSRCFAYESVHPEHSEKEKSPDPKKVKEKDNKKSFLTLNKSKPSKDFNRTAARCLLCKDNSHYISGCPEFLGKSVYERYTFAKENRLCLNCLRQFHDASVCNSSKCRKCDKNHNTLLHRETNNKPDEPEKSGDSKNASNDTSTTKTVAITTNLNENQVVLLPSAVVLVRIRSKFVKARILIDNCSQLNTVSESFVKRNSLVTRPSYSKISGCTPGDFDSSFSVSLNLKSRFDDFTIKIDANVVGRIPYEITSDLIKRIQTIEPTLLLADSSLPYSNVDILVGGQFAHKLLLGNKKFVGELCFEESRFGWVAEGPLKQTSRIHPRCCNLIVDVKDTLARFWEVEEVEPPKPILSEHELCEAHFKSTHERLPNGRFCIQLPRKKPVETLADTYRQARAALVKFDNTLNVETKSMYVDFMKEYRELKHMVLATNFKLKRYFIPHLFVLRPDSSTTSFRAVFNASACNKTGISLNESLMTGPTLQPDLFDTLLNFRSYSIAFSADISKMYRQIAVHPNDWPLQSILWRDDPSQPVQIYELTTLTYGTSPASYIATKCLQELAAGIEQSHPEAAKAISSEFYMDDLLTGANSIDEAIIKQKLIHETLAQAHFPLRKYISNSNEFSRSIDTSLIESLKPVSFASSGAAKILGLQWAPEIDSFFLNVKPINIDKINLTKRIVSSIAAQIFDPLGFAAPVIIRAKILLQDLWREGKDWDDNISPELDKNFRDYYNELESLPKFQIPRSYFHENDKYDLVGFSDASNRAYGAVIYMRIFGKNEIKSRIVCSKSKVAPLKELTIPRLELLGTVLLTKLLVRVARILKYNLARTTTFCDSTIVLAWLKGPGSKYQKYVRNRVEYVNSVLPFDQWNYVKTNENPADLLTRGIAVKAIIDNSFWLRGPEWLTHGSLETPRIELPEKPPEQKVCHVLTSEYKIDDSLITNYSSFDKTLRIVSLVWKYVSKLNPDLNKYDNLNEYDRSLYIVCHISQLVAFRNDIFALERGDALPTKSSLLALDPFLDAYGLLRVGGRLDNSEFGYDTRHQIILSRKSLLTERLVRHIHEKNLHATRSFTLAFLKSKFWIHGGATRIVKKVINNCVWCIRTKGESLTQLMGDLPKERLTISRPFAFSGVDFAGPFEIRCTNHRTMKHLKYYAAFFVCLTTRAVHLEAVSDLSTKAFISTLERFSARRGIPNTIWSDNGTNFVGTKNVIEQHCQSLGITWKFIPARSPHHGGIWESAVKAGKKHLLAASNGTILNAEQFVTILTQVESKMNSRPLYAKRLSTNEETIEALTPGHFLVGSHLLHVPQPETHSVSLIERCNIQRQIVLSFWQLWSKSYLSQLQTRSKWKTRSPNIKVGDIVLLKEDSPPLQWKLGRIDSVTPDAKNRVRIVAVWSNGSLYRRSVQKLVKLPIEDNSNEE